MTNDEYRAHLGSLWALIHSLEFVLRVFLQNLPSARPHGIEYGLDFYSYPVGTLLFDSDITSDDTLADLIDKYNRVMKKRGLSGINRSLVQLRHALAHGRVTCRLPVKLPADDVEMRIINFSKREKTAEGQGRRVCFNERMTKDWFLAQEKTLNDALVAVFHADPSSGN